MTQVIDGRVKRESFPGENKSVCQEATGIGCNGLSESECMVRDGTLSKVETGFSPARVLPGNGQVVDPANTATSWFKVERKKSRHKTVAHSVK